MQLNLKILNYLPKKNIVSNFNQSLDQSIFQLNNNMDLETRNSDLDTPTLGTASSPTVESPEGSSPSSNDEDEYFYRIQNNQNNLNPNKRRKIAKSLWFLGIEENFVISQIFQIFEQSLRHLLVKNHSRDPNLFIGQIIRKVVENENDKSTFKTIDKILIFENKNLKWGEPHLPKRMVVTASTWSDAEGLPIQISEIQNSVASVASTPLSASSSDENFFSRMTLETKDDNGIETKDESLNLEEVEKQWSKIKTSFVLQKLPDFSEVDESTLCGERNLMRKTVHFHRTEDDDEDLELQQPHKRAMLERTFSLRSYKTQEEKDLFTHIPFSDPLNDIITKTFFCSEKGQHFIQKQNEYLKKLMESDSKKFSKDDGNFQQDQEPQELEEEKEDEDDPFDFENFNISIQITAHTRIQSSTQQLDSSSATHSEEKGLLEDTCEYLADLLYGSKDPNDIFFQEQGISPDDFGDFGEEEEEENSDQQDDDDEPKDGQEHPTNQQDEDDVEEEQEDPESEEEESEEEESDEDEESEEDDDSDEEKEEEEYTDYQQLINMQTQIQLVC